MTITAGISVQRPCRCCKGLGEAEDGSPCPNCLRHPGLDASCFAGCCEVDDHEADRPDGVVMWPRAR